MGTYVQLDCLDCEESFNFGKPIKRGRVLTLRMYSETEGDWIDDLRCWQAIQVYLFRHLGHRLIFRRDDSGGAQWFAPEGEVEFDELIAEWKVGTESTAAE